MFETRKMIMNDIHALMSHIAEITTTDDIADVMDLEPARNHLMDVMIDLTGLSKEEVFKFLDRNRFQVVDRD